MRYARRIKPEPESESDLMTPFQMLISFVLFVAAIVGVAYAEAAAGFPILR